jgi:uncharacterized phage-like protein YoqJ
MMIVAGTGHRPADMICGYDRYHPFKLEKLKQIENYLTKNKERIDTVISGVAQGYDQWLAWVALKVGIPLWAFVPFKGQESRWTPESQDQYHKILSKADRIHYVSEPGYAGWKMHVRNKAMLDECDMLLALYNPEKKFGGTYSTVKKALEMGKPIINFWPNPEVPLDKSLVNPNIVRKSADNLPKPSKKHLDKLVAAMDNAIDTSDISERT